MPRCFDHFGLESGVYWRGSTFIRKLQIYPLWVGCFFIAIIYLMYTFFFSFQAYTLQNQYGIPHSEVWQLDFNTTWEVYGLEFCWIKFIFFLLFCSTAGQAAPAVSAARPEPHRPARLDNHAWYVRRNKSRVFFLIVLRCSDDQPWSLLLLFFFFTL